MKKESIEAKDGIGLNMVVRTTKEDENLFIKKQKRAHIHKNRPHEFHLNMPSSRKFQLIRFEMCNEIHIVYGERKKVPDGGVEIYREG